MAALICILCMVYINNPLNILAILVNVIALLFSFTKFKTTLNTQI